MNLTELLAIPVIHLPTARRMGVVYAFGTDDKARRITHVAVVDDESYGHEIYYRYGDVRWGKEAALVSADPVDESGLIVPFRHPILDSDGNGYAFLADVTCDDKGHILSLVNTPGEVIQTDKLLRMGDVVLLRGKARVTMPRKKNAPPEETQSVTYAEEAEPMAAADVLRIAGDYSFLLGRPLREDLMDGAHVVAGKGEVITDALIAEARDRGLMLALTTLSR